jgi:phosphatidate cytidylyltransferase
MVRLASGLVLAGAAVAAIRFLPLVWLQGIAVLVSAITAHEYLSIVDTKGSARQVVPIAATMAMCALVTRQVIVDLALVPLAALAWVALDVLITGRRLERVAADAFATLYIGAPLGMLVVIHALHGWRATLLLVGLIIVSDSSQYYAGRMFGRHALAPAISPKKTIEGAIGGVVAGSAFAMIVGSRIFPESSLTHLGALGAVLVVCGICGDLFESRLKRLAGVKDSSTLIPGHGGALDRLDALLFAAPAFYLFATPASYVSFASVLR